MRLLLTEGPLPLGRGGSTRRRKGVLKALDRACLAPAEWRSGVAGHLILSDEDVTSEIQGLWRRLNTLQHYKVGGAGAERGLGGCSGEGILTSQGAKKKSFRV